MAQMTPRERVMAVPDHQEPDRVPLDIGGGTSTPIVIEGYDRLKAEWGIPGETRVMNKAFRLARLDEAVMQRLGSDTRPLTVKGPANRSIPCRTTSLPTFQTTYSPPSSVSPPWSRA